MTAAPARAAGGGPAGGRALSTREAEIVDLIAAEGLTSREIGERLGCSPFTVRSHVRRVFDKVGVKTRAQLIARLVDRAAAPGAPGAAEIARLTAAVRGGDLDAGQREWLARLVEQVGYSLRIGQGVDWTPVADTYHKCVGGAR